MGEREKGIMSVRERDGGRGGERERERKKIEKERESCQETSCVTYIECPRVLLLVAKQNATVWMSKGSRM